jgi:hypothetical protein
MLKPTAKKKKAKKNPTDINLLARPIRGVADHVWSLEEVVDLLEKF